MANGTFSPSHMGRTFAHSCLDTSNLFHLSRCSLSKTHVYRNIWTLKVQSWDRTKRRIKSKDRRTRHGMTLIGTLGRVQLAWDEAPNKLVPRPLGSLSQHLVRAVPHLAHQETQRPPYHTLIPPHSCPHHFFRFCPCQVGSCFLSRQDFFSSRL